MATMNVSLPDPLKNWVEDRLKDGRFSNTSDYVRHLIRKDQERERAIAALQKAVNEGLASGEPQHVDFDSLKARMRSRNESR
jgi:antitoxin ParD1/3/4